MFRLSTIDFYNMSQDLQLHFAWRIIAKKFNESLICSPVTYIKTRKAINKKIKKIEILKHKFNQPINFKYLKKITAINLKIDILEKL